MILIDTCILSSLAKIDRLSLLDIFFKKHFCYITPAILRELNTNGVAGFKFVDKIEELISFRDAKNRVCILSPESRELEHACALQEIINSVLPTANALFWRNRRMPSY